MLSYLKYTIFHAQVKLRFGQVHLKFLWGNGNPWWMGSSPEICHIPNDGWDGLVCGELGFFGSPDPGVRPKNRHKFYVYPRPI